MSNDDCLACSLKDCIPECFNRHPGSMIALGKALAQHSREKNISINVVTDEGSRIIEDDR